MNEMARVTVTSRRLQQFWIIILLALSKGTWGGEEGVEALFRRSRRHLLPSTTSIATTTKSHHLHNDHDHRQSPAAILISERHRQRGRSYSLCYVHQPGQCSCLIHRSRRAASSTTTRPLCSVALYAKVKVQRRTTRSYDLDYHVFHPKTNEQGSWTKPPPVVTVHGGPGLSCDYLSGMKDVVCSSTSSRSVLLYDQLGCGASDRPSTLQEYSIDYHVQDLEKLLLATVLSSDDNDGYHLYGHSFGGIVAYEFLKKQYMMSSSTVFSRQLYEACQSLVLSNAPADVAQTNQNWEMLTKSIEMEAIRAAEKDGKMNNPFTAIAARTAAVASADDIFHQRHVCRLDSSSNPYVIPKPLADSYEKAASSIWVGTDVVPNYRATPPSLQQEGLSSSSQLASLVSSSITWPPPTLLIRGEFDFVALDQFNDIWVPCLQVSTQSFKSEAVTSKTDEKKVDARVVEMKGCSHHPLLEQPDQYAEILNNFWNEVEEQRATLPFVQAMEQ